MCPMAFPTSRAARANALSGLSSCSALNQSTSGVAPGASAFLPQVVGAKFDLVMKDLHSQF
jgi:hypothetical protein